MALSSRLALAALRLWGPGDVLTVALQSRRPPSTVLRGASGPSAKQKQVQTLDPREDSHASILGGDTDSWTQRPVLALGTDPDDSSDGTGPSMGVYSGRRPISLSVGASGGFGCGRSSEKKLSLQDVAEMLRTRACSRVVVMVGAGISTPSGIPDFRSPGSGLYSNLQQYDIPYPEAIFELGFFFHNPKPFFALAKELYPGHYRPNVTHYFLRLLHDKELLLRLYTQNIDGLERASGIPATKLVEAHGSFVTATCTVCRRSFPGDDIWADVMADRVPRCPVCTGVVKPDIVFFGEQLPARFLLHVADFALADLLLILGTSLEVEPFASLSEAVQKSVPRLLINRDLVGPFAQSPRKKDVVQLGDVVHGVERLVDLLGWTQELQDLMQREHGKLDGKDR